MTKARTQFIYQLTGTIQAKKLKKPASKSKYSGQSYYDLIVSLETPHEHIKIIQVFKNKLAQAKIWTTIEQDLPYQQKYLFHCRNQRGYFYLVDWEELPKKVEREEE